MNQKQQKTTPLTKTKIQLPSSVTRIPHTPINNYSSVNVRILTFRVINYDLFEY